MALFTRLDFFSYTKKSLETETRRSCEWDGEKKSNFTEVFGSTGFGDNWFLGITYIFAIPKLRFCIKKAQNNGFRGVMDKMAIPNWSGTSENLCRLSSQEEAAAATTHVNEVIWTRGCQVSVFGRPLNEYLYSITTHPIIRGRLTCLGLHDNYTWNRTATYAVAFIQPKPLTPAGLYGWAYTHVVHSWYTANAVYTVTG